MKSGLKELRQYAKRQAERVPALVRAVRVARRTLRNRIVSAEEVFTRIHDTRAWGGSESVSGAGSGLLASERVRATLPVLLRELDARSILDAPCGDFNWMRSVELGSIEYHGVDVVKDLVAANRAAFASPTRQFDVVDLIRDVPPRADLVLCRDCFIHFPYAAIRAAVRNFQKSGATWLLTTTFPRLREPLDDIVLGSFRPVNLELPPLGFPRPRRLIEEGTLANGSGPDQAAALGLWRLDELRV